MPLSAEDIRRAFGALAKELEHRGERAEIVVAGGAALVLLFHARETTKDVDAYILRPEASRVRAAVQYVADDLELPSDWLNDGARGYFVGLSDGQLLHESTALTVRTVSIEQLLAMKLAAWRDAIDRADARLLLSRLAGSAQDIWRRVERFVPPHEIDKASYAFDDLWDSLHGTS
jgi:Nucleotidyltransferase of unknown function (DUF6036)